MTSDEHLTLDELAELDEGLLAPERDPQVRRHLAGCTQCQKLADDLTTASGVLRSLGPVPMPADVVARIDQALAALATPASATDADASAGPNIVPNLADVRTRRRWMTAPTSAAAAIAVLAVVAIVIGVTHKSHSTNNLVHNAALPAGSEQLPPLVGKHGTDAFSVQDTGRTYSSANLETLVPSLISADFSAASGGVGSGTPPTTPGSATAPVPTAAAGKSPKTANGTGSTASSSAGTTSSGSGKQESKHHRTKHGKHGGTAPLQATKSQPSTVEAPALVVPSVLVPYQQSRDQVLRCAAVVTDTPGAVPIAVDLGRWHDPQNGKHQVPALIMVFASPNDPTTDLVYVVAAACGQGDILKLESVPASN
jgi:hypothetical protein